MRFLKSRLLYSGIKGSGNSHVESIVYGIYDSKSFPQYDGRRELFCQNRGSMVLSRRNVRRVCPDGAVRLSQMENGADSPPCEWYYLNVFLSIPLWIGLGDAQFRRNVSAGRRWAREIGRFRYSDPLDKNRDSPAPIPPAAFARTDGHNAEIDVETRTPNDFAFGRELLECLIDVRATANFRSWYCTEVSPRASYFYNQFPVELIGNFENWDYAHPVKDWCLGTSKCILDTY